MFEQRLAKSAQKHTAQADAARGRRRSGHIGAERAYKVTKNSEGREQDGEAPAFRGLEWDFAALPLFPPERSRALSAPAGAFQQKLEIGAVDDPLEREADAVADKVMRMPDPSLSVSVAPPQISRKCAGCEKEDEALRMKPAGAAEAVAEAPPIVHEVLREPGQPLGEEIRAFFEDKFGGDFSDVRIHADCRAAESAASIDSNAYTLGSHIAFANGSYEPTAPQGRRLLAHELTHVMQQRGQSEFGRYGSGSAHLRRQPASASGQKTPKLLAPGLGANRYQEIEDLIRANAFQEAVDALVSYKYMDYEIDFNLLANKKITFDPGLTSDDATTSMPSWDYINNKAEPPRVKVGPSAFSSVSYLYSVVMHEYQHVLWQQTLEHQKQSNKAHTEGFGLPDEVEAGAWELLHADETGVANLPDKITQIWSTLNSAFWQLDDSAKNSERPLVNRAFQKAKALLKAIGGSQSLVPFQRP